MFSKNKRDSVTYDITQKPAKTWWGGTKTKAEQRKLKAEILKRDPHAVILDSRAKREKDLEWIDRLEELEEIMDD